MDGGQNGEGKMNKAKIIKQDELYSWLEAIIKKYRTIAPQKVAENEYVFKTLSAAQNIALDYINPIISPIKELLFPAQEAIIEYERKERSWETKTEKPPEKTVLFGLRSCDLSALQFMDKFFLTGFKDNFYAAKRDNLILVNFTCSTPVDSCFCVCADAGPAKQEGYDLQITKLSTAYLVEIGSDKGEELISLAASGFADAQEKDVLEKAALIEETKNNKFKLPTTYFAKAIRHVTTDDVNEKLWDKLGARCIACGTCSFVCPTCTCFNVNDEQKSPDKGARWRTWDSCMYSGFTREVSGHNPRALQKERVKRRYYHKLSYHYMTQMGTHGCVGCGRCIISCLGGIDMFMVSKEVRRNK
jgi:ferredoxin